MGVAICEGLLSIIDIKISVKVKVEVKAEVLSMQRSETETIRTLFQPLKPKSTKRGKIIKIKRYR